MVSCQSLTIPERIPEDDRIVPLLPVNSKMSGNDKVMALLHGLTDSQLTVELVQIKALRKL